MKNYFIVGASSGIGSEVARKLAQAGNKVYGTYNKNKIDSTSDIEYHHLDIMEDELDLSFLPDSLDGVVYCPGSINLKPFHRFKDKDFIDDYQLQVVGAVKVIRNTLSRLKNGSNPGLVLFSTVAVQKGFNFHSQVAASKGAIEGLTRALSAEFAPSIRVNAIAPSLTDTPLAERLLNSEEKQQKQADLNPLKKVGKPENIADMACFLLSQEASWITGQIMHVDGGFSVIN